MDLYDRSLPQRYHHWTLLELQARSQKITQQTLTSQSVTFEN